jgi:hypothetical protein
MKKFSQANDDRHLITRVTKAGFFVLVAVIQSACICGGAVAKVDKVHLHVRYMALKGHGSEPARIEQARLGPMRYYGGPKSPMWRGPVEN